MPGRPGIEKFLPISWSAGEHAIGAKTSTLHGVIFSNYFPRLCNNFSHYRIGLELISQLCNVVCCCKAYHVDIGLHYIIVFELIYQLCNFIFALQNWFRSAEAPERGRKLCDRNAEDTCSVSPQTILALLFWRVCVLDESW